jgi:hypothetical protein
MDARRPFAYGYSGRLLTSTEADEVFCCDGDDEAPYFIHQMDGTVTGVRNVHGGVLATDETGALILLLVPEGSVAWRIELGVRTTALTATESGYWAAVHEHGVVHGHGPEQRGTLDMRAARAAAFRDEQTLAIVGDDGRLEIWDLAAGRHASVELGSACNSVAWSALGWWLVAAEDGVHRVEADGSAGLRFLKWSGDPIYGLCASKAGGLCAFVTDSRYVVVFGVVRDINCGTIIYPERVAYELEFGPANMLGVGIGMGDGNKIDLTREGRVARTDPPPDRPRNRWLLQLSYDVEEVGQALELERAYQAGRIRFEGRDMITTSAPPADASPPTPAASDASAAGNSDLRTTWLLVLAVVVAVALLAWWLS